MAKRILILDDDADFNTLLTDVFGQAGYEVTSVQSPIQALEMALSQPLELVVTDHRMPGMTGAEFVRKLKAAKPSIPIIMVSGYLDNDTIRDLISCGVSGVFLKPLNIFSLLKKTSEIIAASAKLEASAPTAGTQPQAGADSSEEFRHSLGFSFESFPCKSPTAATFAKNLYSLRDFKSNLLLIGESGANFLGICRDMVGFSGEKEGTLVFDQKNFSARKLADDLHQHVLAGRQRVTIAVLATEALRPAEREAIIAVARKEKDFASFPLPVRILFCMREELDTLYMKGVVDENLYIFMGTAEVKIPQLKSCPDDLVLIADRLMKEECKRLNRAVIRLDADCKRFLRELQGPQTHTDIRETMASLAANPELKVARLSDIQSAHESRSAVGKNTVPLRRVLENARLDYIGAIHLLSGENPIETARLTGVDADAVVEILGLK